MSEPERPGPPPITDEMREQAKQTPDSWLYIVDPGYEEEAADIPPEGVVGAYRIDSEGQIDEDFQFNDEYQPSEQAFTIPDPTNDLEELLNRIAAGEAPQEALVPAVLESDLLLYATEDENPEEPSIYAAEMSDGSQLVPACSSSARVPQDWPAYRTVPGRTLVELLNGLDLGLNLDDAVRAVIPNGVLNEAAATEN